MYTVTNFKTKKALKEAVAEGRNVTFYQPGGIFEGDEGMQNGIIFLEGPHYPAPHSWYAEATVKDGKIVKVK